MPSRCLVVYRSIDDAGDGATAITLSKRNPDGGVFFNLFLELIKDSNDFYICFPPNIFITIIGK